MGASKEYIQLECVEKSESDESRPVTRNYQQIMTDVAGEFGFAQIMIVITIGASTILIGLSMLTLSYITAEPDWWLKERFLNLTDNKTYDIRTFKKCPVNTNNSSILFQEGMHTIVSEWQLICDKSYIPTAVSTVQMTGVLVGSAPIGQLAGVFGRKKVFIFFYALDVIALLLNGLAMNWQMLAVTIFFIGTSIGAFLSISKVFLLEFITTRKRTVVGVTPFWAFSTCMLAGLIKIIPNWRHLYFTCAILGVPMFFLMWFFLPESIRWLLTKGKTKEANKILKILARRNKLPEPDSSLLDEIYANNEKDEKKVHAYKLLFKHKFSRWRIFIIAFFWFTCSFVMYALTFGIGLLSGDMALNMLFMGAGGIVKSLLVWILAKCVGRKYSTIIFFGLGSVLSFGITLAYVVESSNFKTTMTVLALLSRMLIGSSWASTALFTIETFPTVVRSEAYAFVSVCARVGGMLAPQNRTLYDISVHLPFTVNGILTLTCAGLCFFLQDTYAKPMNDYYDDEQSTNKNKHELSSVS